MHKCCDGNRRTTSDPDVTLGLIPTMSAEGCTDASGRLEKVRQQYAELVAIADDANWEREQLRRLVEQKRRQAAVAASESAKASGWNGGSLTRAAPTSP